jgi:2-oxoisovalerate dehydrogenase E1 component
LGNGKLTLALVGDGAATNGIAHESYNFATMAQFGAGLPIIYLIENNQYCMTGQQRGEVTGAEFLARHGAAYNAVNMHAEVVDGMNVLAVRDAVSRAAEIARPGAPVLLECLTYRYMGHSLSDKRTTYRTDEEEKAWRECDCIERYRAQLIDCGLLSADDAARIEREITAEIEQAAREAVAGTDPDPASIYDGLLCDTTSEGLGDSFRTVAFVTPPTPTRRDSEGQILCRHAVAEALTEEMARDRRVVLYGEDVADYGGAFQATRGLLEVFGRERVFNTAINEAAIAGTAAGAAMAGLRPVAEIMYIDFVPLALDQIGNQIAKNRYMFGGKAKLPLVIRTTIGGGRGYAGQHSQSLEAILTHFPGLVVVAPSTARDIKGLLKAAIRDDNPVIFIEHQHLYTMKGEVPEDDYTIPIGVADVQREGTDVTIVGYAFMAEIARRAAEVLASEHGVSAEIADPRTLIPLDIETIARSVRKTGRLVVVCQAPRTGCFGEHIIRRVGDVAWEALKCAPKLIAAHDVPPPMAQPLENENIPSVERVVSETLSLLRAPGRV